MCIYIYLNVYIHLFGENNIRHNLRQLQRSSCWSRIVLRRSSALLAASSAMTLRRILVKLSQGKVACGSSGHTAEYQ